MTKKLLYKNNIIFGLMCVLPNYVHSMAVEHKDVKPLTKHLKNMMITGRPKPYKRVPAYLYMWGIHPGTYLNLPPTLQNFIKLLHSPAIKEEIKNEFKGNALALCAVEKILLPDDIKFLTLQDIHRLHALLMKDVNVVERISLVELPAHENYRGVFRTSDEIVSRKDEDIQLLAFVNNDSVIAKLKAKSEEKKISLYEALHLLSAKEQNKIYSYLDIMPPHEKIKDDMQALVKEIHEKTEAADPFEMAARVHQRIIQIHPYVNGNGRLARLLMNYILMKRGIPPLFFTDKRTYLKMARQDEMRFTKFIAEQADANLVTLKIACEAAREGRANVDFAFNNLNGLPVNFPVLDEEFDLFMPLFTNITFKDPQQLQQSLTAFENGVRGEWSGASVTFCSICGKNDPTQKNFLKTCGLCGIPQYCSRECQVADWPSHKTYCLGKK